MDLLSRSSTAASRAAKAGAFQMVEQVQAVDAVTVDFHLARPHGALLADLTAEQGIVRAGTSPEEQNDHLIGTGPFRFVGRTPETVTLEANEDYRGGAPGLSRIVLREIPDSTVRSLELRKGSVQLIVNGLTPDQVPAFRRGPLLPGRRDRGLELRLPGHESAGSRPFRPAGPPGHRPGARPASSSSSPCGEAWVRSPRP